MNEELLCAAVFERAIADYDSASRFLASCKNIMFFHGYRRFRRENAIEMLADVREFAGSQEAAMYAGGSLKVVEAFKARLDEIDLKYHVGDIADMMNGG